MQYKWTTIIGLLLMMTACAEANLTKEEVLTSAVEEMGEVDNYSFEITSEYIDGMGNETLSEVQGTTQVNPLRTTLDRQTAVFGQPVDTKAYYVDDMVYYEDFTAPNYLFKKEMDKRPDHLLDGLKGLVSKMEQLEFSDEGDYYQFDYSVEAEEDKDFFRSMYPYSLHIDPMEKSIHEMYLENSDVVDFHVSLELEKQTFLVKEMQMNYVWNYDVADSGDTTPVSESIDVSFTKYNEIEEIAIPEEDIKKAVTYAEYLELPESEGQTRKPDHVPHMINENLGNSSANLMNGGFFASDGEWVYFSSGEGLFRQKQDGTKQQQLLDHQVSDLNVIDDWLFFIDTQEENLAFKMQTDGSEKTPITDTYTENLMVVDDWIYYTPFAYSPEGEKGVHRKKIDLSNEEKILDHAFQFTVGQGLLFYQTDYPDYVHHIDLNDLEEKPLMYTYLNAKNFAVSDGWIYFEKADDGDRIYRRSLDTRDTYQVTEMASQGFNVKGKFVFYRSVEDEHSLYRYNQEKEENVKLDDGEVRYLHIIDDYLYYGKIGANYEMEWYRIPVDGNEKEEVEL